ncbi:Bug family tripartite tricarboxylate transporter substrate binding protein [Comamonas testosteroni]|uniref:Bug family tripartite tricarboxylate transporter substrate binding protein n=1 Tax=Comamonas testosteroni TaxID=285 RepID=UPI0005B53B7D|nr:tripartite tricarboxylate transporter substrate binding protein [Comamonas testosteroni]
MQKHSRRWMVIASLCCATLATSTQASDKFPSRPIRLIVASSAGSEPDILGRLVALHMSPDLGQPIVVDNKPGAGGLIGVAAVASAVADGYTIGLVPQATLALSPQLLTKKLFDPLTDITPLGLLSVSGNALMVSAKSPVKTYADLVAQAKARPGKMSFGSWGEGSPGHISGEIMKKASGLDMQHVPYKASSEAMMGMLGGEVDAIFGGWGQASTQVKAGKARVIAVTSPQRAAVFPDAPTFKELGISFGLNSWYGLIGPKNLPAPVLKRLEDSMQKAAQHPDVVARLTALGMQPQSSTAAQMSERLRTDHAIWGKKITEVGVQPR